MTESIIFSGSLQQAIDGSIQAGLPLTCFIADDSEESSKWENEYLRDSEVVDIVRSSMILVKLQAGSAEAGFLAAFCPIQEVPYLVIINKGKLLSTIATGASLEVFLLGMKDARVMSMQYPSSHGQNNPDATITNSPSLEVPSTTIHPSTQRSYSSVQPSSSSSALPTTASPYSLTSTPPPRRASATPDPVGRASNFTYLEQQRKRQASAQEERQRVLQLLENDKIERRQKEAKRKQALQEQALAQASNSTTDAPTPKAKENTILTPASTVPASTTPARTHAETAISFRLLDGSSLKTRFPSTSNLNTDIRPFLDTHRTDGDHPYSFLQILAPLPNKQLSISDENATLLDLGLSPTATLVLVPTQSYTSAYTGGGTSVESGLLSRAYSLVYGAMTTVLGVGYPVSTSPGQAPSPAAPTGPVVPSRVQAGPRVPVQSRPGTAGALPMSRTNSANGRIRTLYDQREDEEGMGDGSERKYYNGNQLDFEPKPKDGKEKTQEKERME